MKTKFTLLIAAGLLFSVMAMAQDRGYYYNSPGYGYRGDNGYERHDENDFRAQMENLENRLDHELNEMDRARAYGDWDKVRHEKREIAEIRHEMRELKHRRWYDDDDYDHEYRGRY